MDPILYWNDVALEVQRRDFSVNKDGIGTAGSMVVPNQGGPTRVSRAFAIVHIAMYEAVARSTGGLKSYPPLGYKGAAAGAKLMPSAVGAAAVCTLTNLFPHERLRQFVVDKGAEYLAMVGNDTSLNATPKEINDGVRLGDEVGQAMIDLRSDDGSANDAWYQPAPIPGNHRADPFTPGQGYLGARWGRVRPFCIGDSKGEIELADYLDEPPELTSAEYKTDYAEVKSKGVAATGSGSTDSTRTAQETVIGIFWGYDGAPGIGVPPRLYNQVVRAVVAQQKSPPSTIKLARLFAMVNAGMADAGIVAWAGKYKYNIWRPVIGIREHDKGYGPANGSSPAYSGFSPPPLEGDPLWAPLGIPRTNAVGQFYRTPDFPAYPSGHATFGAVTFDLVKHFFGDNLSFTFTSDEFDGKSIDPTGAPRPAHLRTLTLDQAKIENSLSRVYLGVHWRFDGLPPQGSPAKSKIGGVPAGEIIAKEIFDGDRFVEESKKPPKK